MMLFADTSALYALLDTANMAHASAAAAWEGLQREGDGLVTTSYVVLETFSLLQHRLGIRAARDLAEEIAPLLTVCWVAEDEHRSAVAMVLAANRRDLSLVDCVSFEAMRRLGIRRAFALDEHFREQGFELAP